jgi:hypothetical protein
MSVNINILTPNKAELASTLRSIADLIECASNERLAVQLQVIFETDTKKGKA